MCSTVESCECTEDKRPVRDLSDRHSKCVRCSGSKGQPSLLIRSDDPAQCRECFLDGCVHRFKSAFGKYQMVPRGSKVAVAFSGGLGSRVLVDLIQNNKVRFMPVLFHLAGAEPDSMVKDKICSVMNDSGMESHVMDPPQNRLLVELRNLIRSGCARTSLSECSEVEKWLTRLMLINCSRQLGCTFVLLGSCGTRQAVNFLSAVVGGRGSLASADAMFADRRYRDVVVLRPLFEFMSKELVFYARFQGLQWTTPSNPITETIIESPGLNTIPRLCEDFLAGLQFKGFPSTTQTILSTASKLAPSDIKSSDDSPSEPCRLCMSPILSVPDSHTNPHKLALASLAHSLSLTGGKPTDDNSIIGHTMRFCNACNSLLTIVSPEVRKIVNQFLLEITEDVSGSGAS